MSKHEERLQQFADELIKKIEANEAPWQKGWVSGMGDILPVNHQGKPYRGNNLLDLMMVAQAKGYNDNRWYTFNNAKDYGGHVRRGEKGTVITFFSRTKTENKKDEQGNTIYDKDGKPEKVTYVLDRPIITTAVVFNAEQIDGLPPRELTTPLSEWERIERAEAIAKGIESQGVTIEHRLGDGAYYSPTDDRIVMPERGQFPTPDAYYATLLHEIGHATGHESRLNRDLSGGFGSESYAKEELRAEIASMIVGEQLQIGYDPSQHHAYLKSWAKVIKEDPKEILRAVKDADAISEYVLSFSKDLEITAEPIKEKRTDWGDFPPVISNGKLGDLKNEPEYQEAKGGDFAQSLDLVNKLIKDETIDRIKAMIGDEKPIIVPILSEEATGKNRIPQATAYILASKLGLKVDENIFQSNTVKRTDTGIYHRYVAPPKFVGEVEQGKSYLIVDDTLSVGGTVATLKGYIENQGGKVVGATVMTAFDYNVDIAIKQNMLQSLNEKQGLDEYWHKEFGYSLDKLTQQEAGHLKKPTLEQIQERVQEARQALEQNKENQYEKATQSYDSEQRPLYSTSRPYEATAGRADSLQQERGGVLQESSQYSRRSENQSYQVNSETSAKRIYLYTSYNDLNDLRKLKGQGIVKFDIQNKVWYANEQNKDAVARWTVRPSVPSPEQEFADYLTANGITVEAGHPIFDDKTHRLSNSGSTDKNVMYQAYANPNGVPFARVTNFSRGGGPENWQYPKEYLNTLRNIEAVERAKRAYNQGSQQLSQIQINNHQMIVDKCIGLKANWYATNEFIKDFSQQYREGKTDTPLTQNYHQVDSFKHTYVSGQIKQGISSDTPATIHSAIDTTSNSRFIKETLQDITKDLPQVNQDILNKFHNRANQHFAKSNVFENYSLVSNAMITHHDFKATLEKLGIAEKESLLKEFDERIIDYSLQVQKYQQNFFKPTISQISQATEPLLGNHDQKVKADRMADISKMVASICQVAPPTQNYLSNKHVTANDTVLIVPHSSKLPDEFKDRVMIADTFKQAQYYRENNPDGKLILQRGNLVVPQYNTQGELRAFETITYNGGKYALKDADKKGLMTTLGQLENGKPIIITEGYATGATLHEHTRRDKPTVVVAFGRGGLMEVSQALRESYPDSKIYIGADNDHQKPLEINPATGKPKVNQGLEDAKAVADVVSNVYLLVPQFSRGDTGKDWNDVYVDKGEKEFKRQIIEQLSLINRPIEQDKEKTITQSSIETVKETIQKPSLTLTERLATDVVKKNYPTMPKETLKAIEVWCDRLPTQYANEPLKLQFALERLESKLPDYAKGEVLPLPKTEAQQIESPDKTPTANYR
ncbi:zincin-like metallopeptidase domain-containing protein (plasmid) [Moraxella atlantae]|uniref:zincin-like metallopeptidase domain-containing protein n=1 Tax=Faucicola atlantae TaxID=34059 RepID=UPI0037520B33